ETGPAGGAQHRHRPLVHGASVRAIRQPAWAKRPGGIAEQCGRTCGWARPAGDRLSRAALRPELGDGRSHAGARRHAGCPGKASASGAPKRPRLDSRAVTSWGSDVRVRFAPSPTGYFHVGGARSVLFNWAVARHNDGTLVLRIEDTDAARNRPEWTEGIISALAWLGIDGSQYEGPFYQS